MDRIKGLKEYTRHNTYTKALGIPDEVEIVYRPLARGEYNINYVFRHPVTQRELVLRVNTGSQMHLDNQIEYEYQALKLLESSGRTPRPVYVDGSKEQMDYGIMVMEFLEGRPLNYRTDLKYAAECLADIHSTPVSNEKTRKAGIEVAGGLICPENALQAILDECNEMVRTYYHSQLGGVSEKRKIERMLVAGQRMVDEVKKYDGYCCCINTELNSGNFLINGEGKFNYLIDWEKPLYADFVQDLGHFLAPTTTFWKTDVILTEEEMKAFIDMYKNAVRGRFNVVGITERLNLFIPITCLRGITWCAMAWVQYQESERVIQNEKSFQKMERYLEEGFLDYIEKQYF